MIRMTAVPTNTVQSLAQKEPVDVVQDIIKRRFPEAPAPRFNWCRGYYERCVANTQSGDLVAVYFPAAINYVLDLGYENLVVFKNVLKVNGTADPTFPHWDSGHVFSTKTEEPNDILYPFIPRDLFVGTTGISTPEQLATKLAGLNVTVDRKVGDDSYVVKAPAFREDEVAAKVRQVPGIRYVERNGVVRIIDVVPGWLIDRIF
jgi:hypothetical protein